MTETLGACYNVPAHLKQADALADDSCGVPAQPIHAVRSIEELAAEKDNPKLWLPAGAHWGLNIEHDHRVLTGSFVGNTSWKWCWHITVSPWASVDAMRDVLHQKAAEVHFVIGGRAGYDNPVVIQCLPLDNFGKGLVHPAGTPETNRAHVIQTEICATPESIKSFNHYRALANLFALVTHGSKPRAAVPNTMPRSFSNTTRFSASSYGRVRGHHGHQHVPNNTHFDPTTAFKGTTLVRLINDIPSGGYNL